MTITVPVKKLEQVMNGIEKTKQLPPSPITFGGVNRNPTSCRPLPDRERPEKTGLED